MQTTTNPVERQGVTPPFAATAAPLNEAAWTQYHIIRRNGAVVNFEPSKIGIAMTKAFLAVNGGQGAASARVRELVDSLTHQVVAALMRSRPNGGTFHIEDIQDAVELSLMRSGEHDVARSYVLYRERRSQERSKNKAEQAPTEAPTLNVVENGIRKPLDLAKLQATIEAAGFGLGEFVDTATIQKETLKNLYDGVPVAEVYKSAILAARAMVENDPAYSKVTARLLLHTIRKEVLSEEVSQEAMTTQYATYFPKFIKRGVEGGLLNSELSRYDLPRLAAALDASRDLQFDYLGLQTLYDRYFLHLRGQRIELPQVFFMRVAMGLAIAEIDREARAIEFYQILSSFDFMSSTPTLFNAGTLHSQLSSCYLTTVADNLDGIYEAIKENALLAKYAGGLGNDWTPVRAMRSHIKGTNGESQGVVPFLKVVNDTAVAVNQGGKRKGAVCCYLESWHLDIEEFLELRKNTGDERRRTHDMNTANWIPDLFMKRVATNGSWTFFSPNDVPDLHDLYGRAFEQRYAEYEQMADEGKLKLFKRVEAVTLWRRMLTMLFETGHPWITFKDPSNLRSPQDHTGVVHSSNLCTEILLNTSAEETAVCNLGSINLATHIKDGKLDEELLARTARTALRMLDSVIDINYYPTPEAKFSNLKHRPVGLGLMGFQDALYMLRIPYASNAAIEFADRSMEMISYYAILASTELAAERGAYSSYKGSKWERGLLPIDTIELLAQERGGHMNMDPSSTMDWDKVRAAIKQHGMRNSNTMAIAPTATISNIVGVGQSIEPTFKNLYAKSNLSGEFTTINTYLIEDLKKLNLWDAEMVNDLKYFDGSILEIERIPAELKEVYRTAFEINPKWLIECASRRQKWIDMGQSLNLYLADPNGAKLSAMYQFAWEKGLKTTYYLRTTAATQIEKSTLDVNSRGVQPRWMKNQSASSNIKLDREPAAGETPATEAAVTPATQVVNACSILDPTCEACQ